MQALLDIAKLFDTEIIALLMSLTRIYAFFTGSQLLNSNIISGMPRNVVVIALAMLVAPLQLEQAAAIDKAAFTLALHVFKEAAIGFLLGHVVGWIFWVVTAAGALIDNQRGSNMGSSVDPVQGEESTELGNLFAQAFMTYVMVSGAFLPLLGLLYQSYALWPAGRAFPVPGPDFPRQMLLLLDHAMQAAITLAAPLVALMFAVEFAMAMVARFAPQIQVFVLAMPVKSGLALLVLNLYFSAMLPFASGQLQQAERFARTLINGLVRP